VRAAALSRQRRLSPGPRHEALARVDLIDGPWRSGAISAYCSIGAKLGVRIAVSDWVRSLTCTEVRAEALAMRDGCSSVIDHYGAALTDICSP
jgi:hypothetical protein